MRNEHCNTIELWDREFGELRVIPSSERHSASKALVELLPQCSLGSVALDAGCGNGRNAVYLARNRFRVIALDFSASAIRLARERIALDPEVEARVGVVQANLWRDFPLASASCDLVLDSFVSCHFMAAGRPAAFVEEARRVLKPGGHFLSIHVGDEDAYYSRLDSRGEDRGFRMVVDPKNSIAKRIPLSMGCLIDTYGKGLIHTRSWSLRMSDIVLNEKLERVTYAVLFQKE